MKSYLTLLIIAISCLFTACTSEADRQAVLQMKQAASLMQSDPDSAYVLLTDSIINPELLSAKVNARWCSMLCGLTDSIHTPLPYVPQMKKAYHYVMRHGTVDEQLQTALYLGRSYMKDMELDAALQTYSKALLQSISENRTNQSGYISSYMGDVYQEQDMPLKAVDKYLSASRYFHKAGNFRSEGISYAEASRNYTLVDSLDIALTYMLKADSLITLYGDSVDRSGICNGLGIIYRKRGENRLAEIYLKRRLALNVQDVAANNLALALLYFNLEDFEKAGQYLELAKQPSTNKFTHSDSYYLSFMLEKEKGNLSSALDALEQYVELVYDELATKNRTNIMETEKRYNYTKLLMNVFELQNRQRLYFGIFILLCLVVLVCIIWYKLKLKSRQLTLVRKENDMNILKNKLRNREKEMEIISIQLQQQKDLLNLKMEQLYLQKEQEVETIRQLIQQKNREIIERAAITHKLRKLSEKPNPNAAVSPLSSKDWTDLSNLIETVYHSTADMEGVYDLTEKEKAVCYLTLFNLSPSAVSVLMNQPMSSILKYRQTLRKKLQINNRNIDLYEYLIGML